MPELIFHQVFFPWLEPLTLERGDQVSVSLRANLVNGDYLWRWDSEVLSKGEPELAKGKFKQSNFWAKFPSPERFRKLAADHTDAQ